ncbi:hypothetical protein CRV04_11250 [Candidatus Marinarcus aquaticus]|uniref:histidine kinase n=1 Tax=Candidatus Marinarcus aquaticus TaxID=2044504 RepID=A0A4Q0XMS0_9BACT|nr:hypothetical protein CRV04_11250 [Candidatus Marinarcus aquaticus]
MVRKISLKQNILNIFILFVMFVTLTVGFLSVYSLYQSKLSTAERSQRQVLIQVEQEVEKFLNEIEQNATYMLTNYQRSSMIIKSIVELNPNISSVLVLDKKGQIENFYTTSDVNIYKGFDYSLKRYFIEISQGEQSYWSDTFFSLVDEDQSITYSFQMPLDKVGVIFVKLNSLASFCERYKNSDDSYMIRLLDSKGVVILNQDNPEMVHQQFNILNTSVFKDLMYKNAPYVMGKYKGINQNRKNMGMYTTIEKVDWKVLVREDYDILIGSINEIVLNIIIIALIFLLVSVYIALKIAKRLFKQIDQYTDNIAQISAGNYAIKIQDSPYKEFETFTQSFELMQREIEKREESLEESLNSFKSLVNSTMEAILIHKDGVCLDVNDVAVKLFKYDKKEEMVGKEFLHFVAPSSQKIVQYNMEKETEPYEIEFLKKDGSSFISIGQGKFLHLFGLKLKVSTVIDISEIKHKDKLLFQQSKMASMGEMIGNIAHQWRQPLSAISSAASGMKVQKEFGVLTDDEVESSLNSIMKSTHYLSKTIDDFRNFFKSDKAKTTFDVTKVTDNVISLLASSFKNYDIKVLKEYDESLEILGYENELTQAIINIFNNAKDALLELPRDKKRLIMIKVRRIKTDQIIITVHDSAGGIPKNIMPSIFDPYFTTKYKQQGTGIGLYMTHQIIVSHMKGKIVAENSMFTYENEQHYGAKFTIELSVKK